jgi:hypothetical protein
MRGESSSGNWNAGMPPRDEEPPHLAHWNVGRWIGEDRKLGYGLLESTGVDGRALV